MIKSAIIDSLTDTIKLLPFLFITYLLMEYLEHKASKKTEQLIKRSGKWGPLFGGLLGAVPQCGFSAAGSNLYAGRVITLGTLISIYLSTSDEMLPILISEQIGLKMIINVLALKVLIGIIAGFLIDFLYHRFFEGTVHITPLSEEHHIVDICEHEHCNCSDENILKSAIKHTLQVFAFILIITLVINIAIELLGEDRLAAFLTQRESLSIVLSGIIGLIPNCAASVVITQLYLEGLISFAAMMSGLLVGAGIGLLVLFRINENWKENLGITALLYVAGVLSGFIISVFN